MVTVAERVNLTVVTSNLTDRITAALRQAIIDGQYAPGMQLPSGRELCQQFGVSITVVREALSRLKADGLVSSRQGKGVFVPSTTKTRPFRLEPVSGGQISIASIFELRMGIEVQAASLAAERRKTADLNKLARYLRQIEPKRGGFEQALAADLAFHHAIAEATRNPLIVDFMTFLQPHLHDAIALARATSAKHTYTETQAYREHEAIYQAIADKDPQRARRAVRLVLTGSLKRLGHATPSKRGA